MSDGYLNFISGASVNVPKLDPNAPAGPTGPVGSPGVPGIPSRLTGSVTGSLNQNAGSASYNSGPTGTNGQSCSTGIVIPNGSFITVPYTSNGWMYYIPNQPEEKKEVKPKDGRDGCDCVKCKDFYPYAEPNQDDGTLICFACRNGY